ncbi:transcription initiation factor TFIID subunit 11 [Striga asiatica]|uniref:Transcription initiation factor TFIID subunit 11 n=1 Tax=Striga asiatica TaxID=4170 RepID=A0A5A7Q5F2_STRAF|nr:transcription initiation factor TFIID subunit 11 [Striga asiatica]
MKKSKDPFEVAFEEQEETPPESPVAVNEKEMQTSVGPTKAGGEDVYTNANISTSVPASRPVPVGTTGLVGKNKEDDDEEEEENMEVELGKFRGGGDPAKMAKMHELLAQFTEEQLNRYELFRRSGFQRSNMKRLLTSITGSPKITVHMTIVMSGIAKMFVGELVEAARIVMSERGDTGPIRPCHIREAYRRLKLEGKIPKRSVPRLFR